MTLSVTDQINQLEAARQLVLADSVLYSQIVQGILPIVSANARIELRRWGAEFLAETFASPALALQQKEALSVIVLQTLRDLLEAPGEDVGVVKGVIQAATSIYGLIFRYIVANPHDTRTWNLMASIKSNILKRWDIASTGVRMCCIKFVQRVVQVQTPGVVADPRQRPEQHEISLTIVPRDHPVIPPTKLEPEASGLLDRLLNIFHEDTSDAVLVTATLNCLSVLIRTRQSIASKVLSAVLNFNPLKRLNSPMTPTVRVQINSIERTTRALLMNIYRKNEMGPFAVRIKAYLDRLAQARSELLDEGSRKRGFPSESTDGLDNAKRIRLGAEVPQNRPNPPPLPPGPTSTAQLFTLTSDEGLALFDVTQLPIDLIVKITLPVLHRINQNSLDEAVKNVRFRYDNLARAQKLNQGSAVPPTVAEDEEEDYEPDFEPTEDAEQILNKSDTIPSENSSYTPTDIALGPFKLPQPPPFTPEETYEIGKSTINRVFRMMNVLDEPSPIQKPKLGFNRLAGNNYDQEAWITIITRLATRASAGLGYEDTSNDVKPVQSITNQDIPPTSLADGIRENLWKYIVEDFRARIHIAILWLNEEWFNDRIYAPQASLASSQQKDNKKGGNFAAIPPISLQSPQNFPNYFKWALKVLDVIIPYLDARDKLLIRFLSEIPAIDQRILERVKGLAKDPERVSLAVNAIHYLILGRPPVREMCLDAVEDLWRNYDDAKGPTTKILAKWRPHILPSTTTGKPNPEMPNGVKSPPHNDAKNSNGSVVAPRGLPPPPPEGQVDGAVKESSAPPTTQQQINAVAAMG